ncbi:hypothetical protein RD792_010691 [Penstemon davidsonii]|uniref:WRKY domain-containing protein n=1 Tax=Penstemon davidsonii TaxID=160366 RepID=A0ABR0D2I7_9LAMI|nr:hypothetical protein RD792_010691 [Penstemon davidsonii]
MDDDWDLHAVVRGCTSTTSTATTSIATTSTSTSNTSVFGTFQQEYNFSSPPFQDLFQTRKDDGFFEELHDLYKPFFPKSQTVIISPQRLPISPLSVLQDLSSEQITMKQLPKQTELKQKQQSFSVVNGSKASTSVSHNPTSRSKRRKNQMKRVCHVPAESLSSDIWSWRKYGQKPIKGSPYPRGYYKCSTSKGCMARKQVERNRSDPEMFIVTYTAEHNHPMPTHRNSLAGSTRPKPAETQNSDDPNKPSCSPEMSPAATMSPAPEKLESSREDLVEGDDEEDNFSVSNMAVDDDFFAGLEDFTGSDAGESFSDQFPSSLPFPWLAKTTTAAGGS